MVSGRFSQMASNGVRKVSNGVRKVSHVVRKVSNGVWKVSDGVRNVLDSCHLYSSSLLSNHLKMITD